MLKASPTRFTVGSEIIRTDLRHRGEYWLITGFDTPINGEPRYFITGTGDETPISILECTLARPNPPRYDARAWTGAAQDATLRDAITLAQKSAQLASAVIIMGCKYAWGRWRMNNAASGPQ